MCNKVSILAHLVQSALQEGASQWSNELHALAAADQRGRNKWSNLVASRGGWEMDVDQFDILRHQFIALESSQGAQIGDMFGDQFRQLRLVQIVKEINDAAGWAILPVPDWTNLWLLVQHADGHVAFQKSMLNIFLEHRGQESSHYQYLADRISCHEFGTQIYGTQCICEMQ